ncbi:hypothetical protein P4V41_07380 [Fictibacillus nanhaiensis]|uniref:hypothetical protein n=1 Tax=Fictibacillus nanhaiensis TaxID=742169 RepID=UPI002E1B3932|nr:hypothetical protein [Fictibacillus nanhaiensis]
MKPLFIRVTNNSGVLEDSIEHMIGEVYKVFDTYQYEDEGNLGIEVNDNVVPIFADEYEVVEWA